MDEKLSACYFLSILQLKIPVSGMFAVLFFDSCYHTCYHCSFFLGEVVFYGFYYK